MSEGAKRTQRASTCAWTAAANSLLALIFASLLAAKPAAADFIAFPGNFAPRGAPPILLSRSHPAVPVPPRVLSVSITHEQFRHSSRALEAADPAIMALAGALVTRSEVELGYGLGHGLSGRARLGWASLSPGEGAFGPVGGGEGRRIGFDDLELTLSRTTRILSERLAARVEGGVSLPLGNDSAYDNGSGLTWTPFTGGKAASFGGGAVTLGLSRASAPVAMHLHAEGTWVDRSAPGAGMASAPFPERFPLLVLGPEAHDRLDLRFALAVSRPSAVLLVEMELPLLIGAGDLISSREAPFTLSPGFALRLGVLEFGAQLDLPLAGDDADTVFDPHLAYPDWGLRLRLGTDLLPLDRDRDRDGVGDLTDRCPSDPEDKDGFADRDGCPDPDNDGDMIPDLRDACPDVAEDLDGFADEDGCPDPDNDGDGIPDSTDLCPRSAEDLDGFADEDGCPEREPDSEPPADSESKSNSESKPDSEPATSEPATTPRLEKMR